MLGRLLVCGCAAGVLALGLGSPAPATAPAGGTATATVATVSGVAQGTLTITGSSGRDHVTLAAKGDGVQTSYGFARAAVSGVHGRGFARATAGAGGIVIFDRLVTAYGLRFAAQAFDGSVTTTGKIDHLVVAGEKVGDVTAPERYDLDGYGTLTVLSDGAGMRVRLDRDYHGFPAGSEVELAVVEATAHDGAPPAGSLGTRAPKTVAAARRVPARHRRHHKRRRTPKVPAKLTAERFTFPVFLKGGIAGVGDDYGAAREIGAHKGNDVYAPFGSPIVAVADGRVEKVGTKRVAGNRLWLRTAGGDEFFYAHLSAFTRAARNGARVRAGTVLGFVGNTGDAEPTPPHLHFEIHPAGGRAVDPHTFLLAWQEQRDVPASAWLRRNAGLAGERPGTLVEIRDYIAQ